MLNLKLNLILRLFLNLIVQFGFRKALDKIIGMFSLAVWDKKEKNLFLAIDPLGKKPLYWADEKKVLFLHQKLNQF